MAVTSLCISKYTAMAAMVIRPTIMSISLSGLMTALYARRFSEANYGL